MRSFTFDMFRVALLLAVAAGVLPAQIKVAIINYQQAVIETAEIKKAQTELEARFKPRQSEVTAVQSEIQALQARLQSGQGKITPQEEQNIQAQGQRRQRELQRLTEDLQADVERERNAILGRVGQRMQDVVKKLAEERTLDVVVDASNAVYFKPALDVTKDATAAYDKAYPAQ